MNIILQTERLQLRELTIEDASFILELLNTPQWLRYIGDRNVHNENDAKNFLENKIIRSYQEKGFGMWLVQTKDNFISIGICGLVKRDNLETPDIGFAFLPNYFGKGYAYEIAQATILYAKDKLNISKLSGIVLPENKNSIRLLEKIGLTFVKLITLPNDTEELMLFSN